MPDALFAIYSGPGLKYGQQSLFSHFVPDFPYARLVFC